MAQEAITDKPCPNCNSTKVMIKKTTTRIETKNGRIDVLNCLIKKCIRCGMEIHKQKVRTYDVEEELTYVKFSEEELALERIIIHNGLSTPHIN